MFGLPHGLEVVITIAGSVLASSGFWAYVQARQDRNSVEKQIIKGLAHDRLIHVGKGYIHRGYITYEEYDDFLTYLYKPYAALGGNGLAERIFEEVTKLPMHGHYDRKAQNEESSSDGQDL